jgi:uncharacterized SAM-binding protein YcdF (DUF218 family)
MPRIGSNCYNISMKRFLVVLLVFFIFVGALAATFFFGIGYYLSPQNPLAKSGAIVAISGGETAARTQEAVALYNAGWAPLLIFSGAAADPNGPSNAKAMATAAEAAGVPVADIQLDETSVNTRQNAANVSRIIGQQGVKSIILVTSPYHQRRAEISFHRVLDSAYPIVNHSSYDQRWRRSNWWATPYSRELTMSELQKVAYELASGQTQ